MCFYLEPLLQGVGMTAVIYIAFITEHFLLLV